MANSHTWRLQEKIQEKPIRFKRIVLPTHCSRVYILQSTGDVLKRSSLLNLFFAKNIWNNNKNPQLLKDTINHSDEGLTLETSACLLFTVTNSRFQLSF